MASVQPLTHTICSFGRALFADPWIPTGKVVCSSFRLPSNTTTLLHRLRSNSSLRSSTPTVRTLITRQPRASSVSSHLTSYDPPFPLFPVYSDGSLCLDILQKQWSSAYTVGAILTSIQSLLPDPNPDSPANAEAAKLFVDNKREYYRRVSSSVEASWAYVEAS